MLNNINIITRMCYLVNSVRLEQLKAEKTLFFKGKCELRTCLHSKEIGVPKAFLQSIPTPLRCLQPFLSAIPLFLVTRGFCFILLF